ncbi:hypothetical protein ACFQ14_14640 [Pseudahrensia aquimaris]|uniref:Uncharacterized protein n=1 Tax=Pseudahrensia aquimaris TaxID=744461 RepID=A0ABW3FK61_9HYPH
MASIGAVEAVDSLLKGQIPIERFLRNLPLWFTIALVVGGAMLIPAFLVALPLYKFAKAQIGINFWTCIVFATLIVAVIWLFILGGRIMTMSNLLSPSSLYFLSPGLFAGFIFHRIDQGVWFKKREETNPVDVF